MAMRLGLGLGLARTRFGVFGGFRFTSPPTLAVFNPLTFTGSLPHLALDSSLADSGPLVAGGGAAGYLGSIATYANPGDGSDAAQATEANQPKWLWDPSFTAPFLHLSGVAGNYASVPDEAALRITGDIGVVVHGVAVNTGSIRTLAGKYNTTSNKAYLFQQLTDSKLRFWRGDGTSGGEFVDSTASTSKPHLKATHRVSDHRVRFFDSDDGITWAQVGADVTMTAIVPGGGTEGVSIGAHNQGGGNPYLGAIHRVQIFASTDGTDKRLDIDFSTFTHGATSGTAETGQTVTINRTGNNPAAIIGKPVARFDGIQQFLSGTFASAINGGRMFAVFSVLGNGGEADARILSVNAGAGEFGDSAAAIFSRNFNGALQVSHKSGAVSMSHTGGFSGRLLHEALVKNGQQLSLRNNTDQQNDAETTSIASTGFTVGAGFAVTDFAAIDLEALYFYPPSMTDAQAAKMVTWLNNRLQIF